MDTEHNYIKYDDYKIYINYAYSFDYENKSWNRNICVVKYI